MILRGLSAGLLVALWSSAAVGQSGDTTVVQASAPVHPGVARLVEDFVLGRGSSRDEYVFTYATVFPGRDGSVYVIDIRDVLGREARVTQYDRNGAFMRSIGRNGQGPGEYTRAPGAIKELSDGRILLSDARGLLVFSAAGVGTGRWFAKARAANSGGPILVDPAGFICTYGGTYTDPILYRFRLDGTAVDTIAPPEASFPHPEKMDRTSVPFIAPYKSAWSPLGYFVTSHLATYAIDLRRPPQASRGSAWRTGDGVTSIRRSVAAVPVQTAERNDWQQSITTFMRSGSGPLNWQWSGPEIPTVKPPVSDIFVDSDARIWVRLSQPARLVSSVQIATAPNTSTTHGHDARYRWLEPMLYDVLEPSGRYLGQVRLPDGTFSTAISGNTVWAAVNDSDDVPTIRRYRIDW